MTPFFLYAMKLPSTPRIPRTILGREGHTVCHIPKYYESVNNFIVPENASNIKILIWIWFRYFCFSHNWPSDLRSHHESRSIAIFPNRSHFIWWWAFCLNAFSEIVNSYWQILDKSSRNFPKVSLKMLASVIPNNLCVGLARTLPHFLTTTDFDDILPQNQSESETNEF